MRNSSCTVPTTLHPRPPVSQPNSAGAQSPQGSSGGSCLSGAPSWPEHLCSSPSASDPGLVTGWCMLAAWQECPVLGAGDL